jgi:hypothetical protein
MASVRFPCSSSFHLCERCLGLREPEGHLHSTVHVDRHRQLGTGLLALLGRSIQRAEAPVTVRLEWAHAQLLSQREGLAVVGFGLLTLKGITMRGDLAKEAQGIRLVAMFFVGLSQCERTLGQGTRLFQTVSEQGYFAQPEDGSCTSSERIIRGPENRVR